MKNPTLPEDVDFRPISESLITVRRVGSLLGNLPFIIVTAVMGYFVHWAFYIGTAFFVLILVWIMWLIPRQVRNIKYAEGDSEFIIRRGIMFRSLTAVPYGRIQYVDVNEGPIARHYGIATITLHTASAETAGSLDGLPAEEANRLRDLLAHRGSAELAGL